MPVRNGHPAAKASAGEAPTASPPVETTIAAGPAVYENMQAFSIVTQQDATISQSGAAIVIAGGDLQLRQGGAGVIIAGNDAHISQGGCGFLMAGRDVTIVEGDAAKIQAAGGTLRTEDSSLLLAAREAHIQHGSVGLVLSGKTTLDEHTHVTLNISFYELAGAFVGLAFLLPVRLLQRMGSKAKLSGG